MYVCITSVEEDEFKNLTPLCEEEGLLHGEAALSLQRGEYFILKKIYLQNGTFQQKKGGGIYFGDGRVTEEVVALAGNELWK